MERLDRDRRAALRDGGGLLGDDTVLRGVQQTATRHGPEGRAVLTTPYGSLEGVDERPSTRFNVGSRVHCG